MDQGTDTAFVVDLDGFEGPLDLLLDLARSHKFDLGKISVSALAEQYLTYLETARRQQLEIAAEYLVMAAWLTFLKSQLLLPKEERDEPEAEELAQRLAQRLKLLDALRHAADELMSRPLLGVDRFARGAPEPVAVAIHNRYSASLADLLGAYSRVMTRQRVGRFVVEQRRLVSVEDQLSLLSRLLTGRDWSELSAFLPARLEPGMHARSAQASTLVAGLELGKRGEADLVQERPFGPIMIKRLR